VKITRIGDWKLARRLVVTAEHRFREATRKAVLQEAHFFRSKIVDGLREQAPGGVAFKPLSPATLAIRRFLGFRGTKALIVRGDLRNAIAVVADRGGVFIGILRGAKTRDGRSLVNVAEIHEFGARPIVVRLTDRARRFLFAALRKAGAAAAGEEGGGSIGIAVFQIPARPFLRPVFERWGRPADVTRRFLDRVARLLDGDYGR
jgi:hypothetical protein